MKKVFTTSLFFLALTAFSQQVMVRLKNENVKPTAEITSKTFFSKMKSEESNKPVFRILSFDVIPSKSTVKELKAKGIYLLSYLPDNSYMAKLNLNEASFQYLKSHGCISALPILARYKLEKNLFQNYVPDYCKKGEFAEFEIQYYKGENFSTIANSLKKLKIQIIGSNSSARTFTVLYPASDFLKLAELPFICFVQPATEAPQKDDDKGRTLHRVQTLNGININNPTLPGIDGSGVSIGLADDGFVGPHIDFKGRITNYSPTTGQTHGDMTSGIAVGAGNLDPTKNGGATGSYIHVYDINGYPHINGAVNNMMTKGIFITSTSYSQGCNLYDVNSQQGDMLSYTNPNLLFVFSGGNNASGNCNYGAGAGWGNITGGYKMGKNVIAAANVDASDVIDATSSRGPASDGRIKPDIAANGKNQESTDENNTYQVGGGTSAACPSIAGTVAMLYQAYRGFNSGVNPEGALIKSILMNTAHDLGNAGPDFTYGYGRINLLRAYNLMKENRYFLDSISQSQNKIHNIVVPAGVTKMKVMIYWLDEEGSPSAAKALVNDIDMSLTTPSAVNYNPWVLDTTPVAANLSALATRGFDHLNNVEQVTLDNPAAGTYDVNVSGTTIPFGDQRYYILWDFYYDQIDLTYPIGGEGFVPSTTEVLRWDNFYPNGTFTLQYSTNGGGSWTNISTTVAANAKQYNWTVPNIQAANVLLRINNTSAADTTVLPFTIIGKPTNITFPQACPDSITISWTGVTGATGYEVSRLGAMYMDSIAYTTATTIKVPHFYLDTNWYSVRSIISGQKGRRANAVQKLPGLVSCILATDAEASAINYPGAFLNSLCDSLDSIQVVIVYKNAGANPFSNVSFSYKFGNLPTVNELYASTINPGVSVTYTFTTLANLASQSGTIPFKVWVSYGSDMNNYNDTLNLNITFSPPGTAPFVEDFQGATFPPLGWSLATTFAGANWRLNPNVIGKSGASTQCAEFDNCNLNQVASKEDIISKVIDLSGTTNPQVFFDVAYIPFTGYYDSLEVRLANGCGGTFGTLVYKKGGVTLQTDSTGNTNACWAPTLGSHWRTDSASLAAFTGSAVRVMFRNINRYGNFLFLDNINIKSTTIGISSILDSPRMFGLDPNPTSGAIHFSAQNVKSKKIVVSATNLEGRQVLNELISCNGTDVSKDLDLSKCAAGAYMFKIIFDDKVYHYKVIKN